MAVQIVAALLLSVLGVRLYFLQVVRGRHYAEIAQNQRIRLLPIAAPRGIIFDRNGHPLVDSRPIYNVILSREDVRGKELNSVVQPLSEGLGLDADVLRAAYARTQDPARATLVVAGDLGGLDVAALTQSLLGDWAAPSGASAPRNRSVGLDTASGSGRIVRVVHRPGSVQTEIRIGHRGLPRRIADFHALSVMSAILGGLFNSRLNMQLREAKGYTYGAGAGFDLRRGAGPFSARAAVNTEVTVPAILDTIAELERMRDAPVEASELAAARDFLIGVFPLRFETAGAVAGALAGLAVHDLPIDELIDYRARIEAVDIDAVAAAAQEHLHVDRAAIVLVGDIDAFGPALEAAGLGTLVIDRDDGLHGSGVLAADDEAAAAIGPTDEGVDTGPTAGAEDLDLPGTADDPATADTTGGDRQA